MYIYIYKVQESDAYVGKWNEVQKSEDRNLLEFFLALKYEGRYDFCCKEIFTARSHTSIYVVK